MNLPPHPTPSMWSQSTRFALHASYSKFPPAIYLRMVLYTVPRYSFHSPHSPLPCQPVSPRLFSVSVSMLPCAQVHQRHLSRVHVCARTLNPFSRVQLPCDPLDCSSPPGSSVQEILQVRILEWVAISSSRGSS